MVRSRPRKRCCGLADDHSMRHSDTAIIAGRLQRVRQGLDITGVAEVPGAAATLDPANRTSPRQVLGEGFQTGSWRPVMVRGQSSTTQL
jgi:hypothetical protein